MVHFSGPPLGTSATARRLERSETRVRQLVASGQLRAIRTSTGRLLFDPADVARFAEERERRQERRG